MHGKAMMRRLHWPLATGYCLLVLSGCTHAHAKISPDQPALDMPAPPPRDVEPLDAEVPAPMPLPDEPEHQTPARARPAQREPSRPEPKTEPPKTEPEAPKPPEEAPHPASPPPPTTLQTTPPAVEGEVERSIRATLAHATAELSRVDYRVLNKDARNQYDLAKNWIRQSEALMAAKNLALANMLAGKAKDIAVQLAGK
jgi:hypothetical protein